jgi:tRNA threonylcarbamoyladenosine biosynthesis protein TsaB
MLLAIDTSTRLAGVAVYDGVQVVAETTWTSHDYHTVELVPIVAEVLNRSRKKAADLEAVAVALGPGSFTGLRIGLAAAKGLALGAHLPLLGVPTLDILAASQPIRDLPLVAVLQAGRGRLAVGHYNVIAEGWSAVGSLQIMDVQTLAHSIHSPTLVCGELTEEERAILARKRKNVLLATPAQSMRRPSFLAELAWKRWQAGQVDDPVTLAPIYLHIGDPIPG